MRKRIMLRYSRQKPRLMKSYQKKVYCYTCKRYFPDDTPIWRLQCLPCFMEGEEKFDKAMRELRYGSTNEPYAPAPAPAPAPDSPTTSMWQTFLNFLRPTS